MKTKYTKGTRVGGLFASILLILTGCSQTVWVDTGATEADSQVAIQQCLSAAYLQAPSAPTIATIGSGVPSPSFTTCSAAIHWKLYHVARPLHAPLVLRTDSNASARNQLFRQCMSAAGWSEKTRSSLDCRGT